MCGLHSSWHYLWTLFIHHIPRWLARWNSVLSALDRYPGAFQVGSVECSLLDEGIQGLCAVDLLRRLHDDFRWLRIVLLILVRSELSELKNFSDGNCNSLLPVSSFDDTTRYLCSSLVCSAACLATLCRRMSWKSRQSVRLTWQRIIRCAVVAARWCNTWESPLCSRRSSSWSALE